MINTLVIIDWDDTLFPTTWIQRNNIKLQSNSDRIANYRLFAKLDDAIYNVLRELKAHGKVIIITNAMHGWVKMCLDVLPKSNTIIYDDIDVISARSKYHQKGNTDIYHWKNRAFKDESDAVIKKAGISNIISIGDADYEHKALISLYGWNNHLPKSRYLKSIRFADDPSYNHLMDQLHILKASSETICRLNKHIELHFKAR